MAEFPHDPEDLWRIKMHPEAGYISLVSFDSEFIVCLVRPLFLAPDFNSVALRRG